MIAFAQMSRTWVWIFAIVIILTFALAAILIAAPNIKKHVDLVALALALWAIFYFYALLANQRGALSLSWLAKLRAAIVAFVVSLKKPATVKKFLSGVAGFIAILISNGVLSGRALLIANVVIAALASAGIWGFANAPV